MEDEVVLEKIRQLTAGALSEAGVELVDLTFRRESGGMAMRFTVDKAGGITIGECGTLSRRIEAILDGANAVEERYMLEVQSPGLDRKLVRTADFERAIGKDIFIVTHGPVEGRSDITGKLKWAGEESIKIELPSGDDLSVPRNMIAKAKLHIDF